MYEWHTVSLVVPHLEPTLRKGGQYFPLDGMRIGERAGKGRQGVQAAFKRQIQTIRLVALLDQSKRL